MFIKKCPKFGKDIIKNPRGCIFVKHGVIFIYFTTNQFSYWLVLIVIVGSWSLVTLPSFLWSGYPVRSAWGVKEHLLFCSRGTVVSALKLVGPWLTFRLVWRPFVRFLYRTLIKSYGYQACDAHTTTRYVTVCCGIAALLVSMYLNGQIYWACAWSVQTQYTLFRIRTTFLLLVINATLTLC